MIPVRTTSFALMETQLVLATRSSTKGFVITASLPDGMNSPATFVTWSSRWCTNRVKVGNTGYSPSSSNLLETANEERSSVLIGRDFVSNAP